MAGKVKKHSIDFYIFFSLIVLLGVGVLMVFSASSVSAFNKFQDPYFWFKKQVIWVAIGLVAMVIMINIDYRSWRKWSRSLVALSGLLLLIVLLLGDPTKGAVSWIKLGPLSFQPSEFVKLSLVIFLAREFSLVHKKGVKYNPLLGIFLVLGGAVVLIALQPDYGTILALGLMCILIFWSVGLPWYYFALLMLMGAIAVLAVTSGVIDLPVHIARRLAVYFDPFSDPVGAGYQIVQSMYALGSGGLFGMGLGQSMQKYLWLPEQHNDFIFSVIGEELGFMGCLLVICLYAIIINRGFLTARFIKDGFGAILAIGVTSMVISEAIINIAVVTGVMPVTGVTLPFISYGGSSLLFKMVGMGLLLNVSRYVEKNLD